MKPVSRSADELPGLGPRSGAKVAHTPIDGGATASTPHPAKSALLHDRCWRNRPLGPVHTLEVHDSLVDEIEAGFKHRRILLEAAIAGAYLRVVWSGSVAGSRFGAVCISPAAKRLRKGTRPAGKSPLTESAPKAPLDVR